MFKSVAIGGQIGTVIIEPFGLLTTRNISPCLICQINFRSQLLLPYKSIVITISVSPSYLNFFL
jgi:hypothetical protein